MKRNVFTKPLSVILAVLMVFSVFGASLTALAAIGGIPTRSDVDTWYSDSTLYGAEKWDKTTDAGTLTFNWDAYSGSLGYDPRGGSLTFTYPSHIYLNVGETLEGAGYMGHMTASYGEDDNSDATDFRVMLSSATWGESTRAGFSPISQLIANYGHQGTYSGNGDKIMTGSSSHYDFSNDGRGSDQIIADKSDDNENFKKNNESIVVWRTDVKWTNASTNNFDEYVLLTGTANKTGEVTFNPTENFTIGAAQRYTAFAWHSDNGTRFNRWAMSGGSRPQATPAEDALSITFTVYDKSELNRLIAAADNGTLTVDATALANARAVLANREVMQADIDAAAAAMGDKMTLLINANEPNYTSVAADNGLGSNFNTFSAVAYHCQDPATGDINGNAYRNLVYAPYDNTYWSTEIEQNNTYYTIALPKALVMVYDGVAGNEPMSPVLLQHRGDRSMDYFYSTNEVLYFEHDWIGYTDENYNNWQGYKLWPDHPQHWNEQNPVDGSQYLIDYARRDRNGLYRHVNGGEKNPGTDTRRSYCNAFVYHGSGDTTNYYEQYSDSQLRLGYSHTWFASWIQGGNQVPDSPFFVDPSGSIFIINYQPIYSKLADAAAVKAIIEGDTAWQYTEASVKRAKATIMAMIAANPKNFTYENNEVEGVQDCAAAIKDAVYMLEHDGLTLVKKQGTVTFVSQTGAVLDINGTPATYTRNYGETVAANEIPVLSNVYYRTDNAQWDYSEDLSWEPALPATIVFDSPEKIFTIHDEQTVQLYHVQFLDDDGATVLAEADWQYGDYPDYGGTVIKQNGEGATVEAPAKQDNGYTYAFDHWVDLEGVEYDLNDILRKFEVETLEGSTRADLDTDLMTKYTAVYTPTVRTYTVRFFDLDDHQIGADQEVEYGASAEEPTLPTKAAGDEYHYVVAWDTDAWQNVTENTDVHAEAAPQAHVWDYENVSCVWTGYTACTATVPCTGCEITKTYTATSITSATSEPWDCTHEGVKTYTAHFEVDDLSATATEDLGFGEHDWGEWSVIIVPTIGAQGEAQRVCSRNAGHIDTVRLSVLDDGSATVTVDPTEGSAGELVINEVKDEYDNVIATDVPVTIPALNTTDYTKYFSAAGNCTRPGMDYYSWNGNAAYDVYVTIEVNTGTVDGAHNYADEPNELIRPVKNETTGEWGRGTWIFYCFNTTVADDEYNIVSRDETHDKTEEADRADYTEYDDALADVKDLIDTALHDYNLALEIELTDEDDNPYTTTLGEFLAELAESIADIEENFPLNYVTTTAYPERDEQPYVDEMADGLRGFGFEINDLIDSFGDDAYNHYTVLFKNTDDAELLKLENLLKDADVAYTGATPVCPDNNAQYTYRFIGWTDGTNDFAADATLPAVSANVTYTARYDMADPDVNSYTVRFFDLDGHQIGEDQEVEYGGAAVDPGLPTKEDDETNHYSVAWDTAFGSIIADTDIHAVLTTTPHTWNYGAATYSWTDYTACTATVPCTGCEVTKTFTATSITFVTSEPWDCVHEGTKTYTAHFEVDDLSDTATADLGFGDHAYGGDWTVLLMPTTTAKGVAQRVCANNSEHKEEKELAMIGAGDVTVDPAPTETGDGTLIIDLKDEQTGDTLIDHYEIVIPKLDNEHYTLTGSTEGNCVTEGSETWTWNDNAAYGVSVTIVKNTGVVADAHDWSGWSRKDENDHQRTCLREGCGAVETQAHQWDEGTSPEATCLVIGNVTHHCLVCSAEKVVAGEYGPHDWGAWTVETAPTTSSTGLAKRVCSRSEAHFETKVLPVITDENITDPTEDTPGAIVIDPNHEPADIVIPALNDEDYTKTGSTTGNCSEESTETYSWNGNATYGTSIVIVKKLGVVADDHDYGAWTVETAPTTSSTGLAKRVCSRNEAHFETKVLPVITDGNITEPTETDDGKIVIDPENHEPADIVIPALNDEDYTKTGSTTGNCSEESTETYSWNGNATYGTSIVIVKKLGVVADDHDYGEWRVETAPTTSSTGLAKRVCSRNEAHFETKVLPVITDEHVTEPTETDDGKIVIDPENHEPADIVIPALEGNEDQYTLIDEAAGNCTEHGHKTYAWNGNATYGTNVTVTVDTGVVANDHAWGEWTVKTLPTLTAEGLAERVCGRNAAHKETKPLQKLTAGDITVDPVPTETEDGKIVISEVKDEDGTVFAEDVEIVIPHLNETDYTLTENVAGNCTEHGHKTYVWKGNAAYGTDISFTVDTGIVPNAHAWGEWQIITPADYGVEGEAQRECSRCHVTESKVLTLEQEPDRRIKFNNINRMHYVLEIGENGYAVFNSSTILWYSAAELKFHVYTYSNFGYDGYEVYINGEPATPDANGIYTIPAGSTYDTVSVYPVTNAAPGTPSEPSGACGFCGKVHPNTFWGRLVALIHAILLFFRNLFKK